MKNDELVDILDRVNSLSYRFDRSVEVNSTIEEVQLMKSKLSREFGRYSDLVQKINKVDKNGIDIVSKGVQNNMRRIKNSIYKVNNIIDIMKQQEEC